MCNVIFEDATFNNKEHEWQYHHQRAWSSYRFGGSYNLRYKFIILFVLGQKYELIRHHSGIYFIRKAPEQVSMNALPMESSDVQRLVQDQNRLKHQLKITRQNNQRLRKTVFELESKIQVWLESEGVLAYLQRQPPSHELKNVLVVIHDSWSGKNICIAKVWKFTLTWMKFHSTKSAYFRNWSWIWVHRKQKLLIAKKILTDANQHSMKKSNQKKKNAIQSFNLEEFHNMDQPKVIDV